MKKNREYYLTKQLLAEYKHCALKNGKELLSEAEELLINKRYARAYFLACASIEETGKAYEAFFASERNLEDPSVQTSVKLAFENHATKTISALICLLKNSGITKAIAEYYIELPLILQEGREKSMYVDIRDNGTVTLPKKIVKVTVAENAVSLASKCFGSPVFLVIFL